MFPGAFMFIGTDVGQANNNAYLRSTALYTNDGRPKCLTLWYNAYGQGVGSLRVSISADPNGFGKTQLAEIPSTC